MSRPFILFNLMIRISDKAKLIYKEKIIEYPQINENINLFSSLIEINKEDRVAIFSYNRPEWIYALYGIWKKGGIPVPIDFMSTEEEFKYIIEDSNPEYIFTSKDRAHIVKKVILNSKNKPEIIVFENIKPKRVKIHSRHATPEDTALILYTSGTTGNPKGVMLSYRNLLSNIEGLEETNIADSSDSTVAILPFHHSYPLMVSLIFPLYIGAKTIFIPSISSEEILSSLQKHRVTFLIGVPRLYELFHRKIFQEINRNKIAKFLFWISKNLNNQKLSKKIFKKVHDTFGGNIKYFVSGGAKLDVEIAKDLWALGFKIIEGYGLTETSPIVSFNPPDKIKLGSAGKPIKNVQVKIEKGEILVKGPNVMKGYWNKPEETKKVIKNGWFYTGDLGYLDEENYLYITGRKKDIIVLPSGKNINPEELENKLLKASSLIKEVAVIYKDGKLMAIIYPDYEELRREGIVNIEETIKWNVIDKVNRNLPDYKRISNFIVVSKELPKTRIGKIRRFLLGEFLKEVKERKEIKEPKFEEYKIIKKYLESVVKRKVYPDEHIEIDLGLDSLEKIELLSFIEENFGISLTEKELLQLPTVEKLALFIKNKKKKIEAKEINWKEILSKKIEIDISSSAFPLLLLKRILKPVFKIYFKLEIEGLENLPERNFILAPNHQSFLDGFLLIASLPDKVLKDTYFLAEEIYFPKGIRKKIGKEFHVLTVNINKDLKGSLQKVAGLLRLGKNVVIFPEGARTRDGKLLPFKRSFAILSKELNVPVIPVAISGAYKAFPIGSFFPKPYKIKIKFLKPVRPDKKGYEEIVKETYNRIEKSFHP